MKRLIIFVMAISMIFLFSANVFADSIDEKKDQLDAVGEDIENAKKELEWVNLEQSKVGIQLDKIEKELGEKQQELQASQATLDETRLRLEDAYAELAAIEATLHKAQTDLENTKTELNEAIEAEAQQKNQMAERLRAMYMNSKVSYLELLIECKSLNELLTKIEMVKQLISYDNKVFEEMEQHRMLVDAKKAQQEEQERTIRESRDLAEAKKLELERQEQDIQAATKKIQQQKLDIEAKQAEKSRLMDELEKEKKEISKQLDELEKLSRELEKKIQELIRQQEAKNKSSQYTGGQFAWPAPGYDKNYNITSPFGWRMHPILKVRKFHSGIDISGYRIGDNKPAVAAADGVVIFAQSYGGYGNTVIIDHGSNITTLYAHNAKLLVSEGDTVKKGQKISIIGTTGLSTGHHLHFEVRVNGEPVDPMPYFK
jgi:murein DD-endopeptidase MepM/ murein hydrolase activator NlpD